MGDTIGAAEEWQNRDAPSRFAAACCRDAASSGALWRKYRERRIAMALQRADTNSTQTLHITLPLYTTCLTDIAYIMMRRPNISATLLSLLVAAYVLLLMNNLFWRQSLTLLSHNAHASIVFGLAYCALIVGLFMLVSVKYVIKPALIGIILISTFYAYFADNFGVLATGNAFRDVLSTSKDEAKGFLCLGLVWTIVAYGVVPSLIVAVVRIRYLPPLRTIAVNSAIILGSLGLAAVLVLTSRASLANAVGGRLTLLHSANPIGPIAAAANLASFEFKSEHGTLTPIGTDARPRVASAGAHRPLVTVLVVGESARAQNFGLDGYGRDTTPELRAAEVINFPHATSCGTNTAVSVPCMFSASGRRDYSESAILSTENLLDVLKRAGVHIAWWDNDGGSKGVADRVDFRFAPLDDPSICRDGECLDQILIKNLAASLDAVTGDSVIVLHMRGSHGPSYRDRYPPEFRHFEPACATAQLSDCSSEEIVDAYDNTLLYTDHLLGEVIGMLKAREETIAPAVVFLSDHGESLGESGIYMHGMPYSIAPSQQTHIPFLIWLSGGFSNEAGIDASCLRSRADEPVSQDNLFHSVLGMMDVSTRVRDPAFDLFSPCRSVSPQVSRF